MAKSLGFTFVEMLCFVIAICCGIIAVDGGECCRTNRGSFWCPDFCCLSNTERLIVEYSFRNNGRFFCCSNPRERAHYGFRTDFCSSWFTHSHNLWVPILIAVVVIALLLACGICCCCIPGFCFCC